MLPDSVCKPVKVLRLSSTCLQLAFCKMKGEAARLQVEFRDLTTEPSTFIDRIQQHLQVPTWALSAYLLLHVVKTEGNNLVRYVQDLTNM